MTLSLTTKGGLLRGEAGISQLCIINRTYLAFPLLFQWSSNDLFICLLIWICHRSATYSNTVNTLIFYANVDAQEKIHMLLFQSRGRVREWFMMWHAWIESSLCRQRRRGGDSGGVSTRQISMNNPRCVSMKYSSGHSPCTTCLLRESPMFVFFSFGKTWFAMCHMIPTESA